MKRQDFSEMRREMAQNSIEELLALLESDELQTRFLAEMCLRDATST